MTSPIFKPRPFLFTGLLLATFTTASAKELLVDSRGGAPYLTLAAAAAVALPGDIITLAKGSGPYRESLYIRTSGTQSAPIVVEGNGATITALQPLRFREENGQWIAKLPVPFPCVIMQKGKRILQSPDAPENTFLGPIILGEDKRTVILSAGASPEGWEASSFDSPVRIQNASWQTYRNIVATGGTNDGFNLHGDGTGLLFENITGANNLDEGFSAHDTIKCEVRGGDFWGNDNGVSNGGEYRMSDIRIHDNLGWGFVFNGGTGHISNLQTWGNGMAQIIFGNKSAGSFDNVTAWSPTWPTRPWRSYKESSTSRAPALATRFDEMINPDLMQGRPTITTTPPPSTPLASVANPS